MTSESSMGRFFVVREGRHFVCVRQSAIVAVFIDDVKNRTKLVLVGGNELWLGGTEVANVLLPFVRFDEVGENLVASEEGS